jgi:hypothetical protein
VAVKAEIMEHFLHLSGDILCVFMAVVTGAAAGVVDKVMVAINTLGSAVISVIEAHWYQGFIGSLLTAVALGKQQQNRRQTYTAHCKWPHGAPVH